MIWQRARAQTTENFRFFRDCQELREYYGRAQRARCSASGRLLTLSAGQTRHAQVRTLEPEWENTRALAESRSYRRPISPDNTHQ